VAVARGWLVDDASLAAVDDVFKALALCVDAVPFVADADSELMTGVGVTVVAAVVAEDVCAPVVVEVDVLVVVVAAAEDEAGVAEDPSGVGGVDASFGVLLAKGLRGVPATKVGVERSGAVLLALEGSAGSDTCGGDAASAPLLEP